MSRPLFAGYPLDSPKLTATLDAMLAANAVTDQELDALRQRARHEELVTRYLREFFSETKRER